MGVLSFGYVTFCPPVFWALRRVKERCNFSEKRDVIITMNCGAEKIIFQRIGNVNAIILHEWVGRRQTIPLRPPGHLTEAKGLHVQSRLNCPCQERGRLGGEADSPTPRVPPVLAIAGG